MLPNTINTRSRDVTVLLVVPDSTLSIADSAATVTWVSTEPACRIALTAFVDAVSTLTGRGRAQKGTARSSGELADFVGPQIRQGDVCAGNDGPGLVRNGSANGAAVRLGEEGTGAQERARDKAIHTGFNLPEAVYLARWYPI